MTLKQLEALYWVVELGTFERAAAKLNTTQSAISKRIKELESACGLPLFNRDQRSAQLTQEGEHVLMLGREMLALQDRIFDLHGKQTMSRRLRLGVTELTTLTWLPRLVAALRKTYPMAVIEPDVDMSRNLHERLLEGTIDLIIIPEAMSDPDTTTVRLAEVANVWMAQPGLVNSHRVLTLQELAEYPILTQDSRSGSGLFYNRWLKSQGVVFPRTLSSDSLTALLGLTVAGLGITYLPKQCFRSLVVEKKLVVIPTKPPLPPVPYAAIYRNDRPSVFISAVIGVAREVCDFSRQLQR